MANVSLICHSDTPPLTAAAITVASELQANGRLWLRYHVECALDSMVIGAPQRPERTDGLWTSTCFELFVAGRGDGYCEYNFAPSSQWAAYSFSGYRADMQQLPMEPPEIGLDASASHIALEASLFLPCAPSIIGLSAVIHEEGDIKSYWALAHPPGKPDFHHPDCFVLHLAPPERP